MSAGLRRGIPFVVAAPSGTGKTTVCRRVVARDPLVELSVSHTTRGRRPGEEDGVAYHFVTREAFQALVDGKRFLEWAEYHGNRYGTSWDALDAPLARGRDVLLEIEVQGARQVRQNRRHPDRVERAGDRVRDNPLVVARPDDLEQPAQVLVDGGVVRPGVGLRRHSERWR